MHQGGYQETPPTMRTLPASMAAVAMLLSPAVAFGAGPGFDLATASCSSPEVEQYIMTTLPSMHTSDGRNFGADYTVERIIFATNARQSAVRLACKLTVRIAHKGTDVPWQGLIDIDRMPNGKLRPTWATFSDTMGLQRPRLR